MSHYHTGFLDGDASARGTRLGHNPALVRDQGYVNGFEAGHNAAVKAHRAAIAAGLVAVVSRSTETVHYAVEDPADDSPMCGQGEELNGTDVDRTEKLANCKACVGESATWVSGVRAELTAR